MQQSPLDLNKRTECAISAFFTFEKTLSLIRKWFSRKIVERKGQQRKHDYPNPVMVQRIMLIEAEELPVAPALL